MDTNNKEHRAFEIFPQRSMSLESLGHTVQTVANGKQEDDVKMEYAINEDQVENKEYQKRRRMSYDTVSIADSNLGGFNLRARIY